VPAPAVARRREEVIGVGVGIPGPLDGKRAISVSNILPGWVGLRPADLFARGLGLPVQAENDANLGALAEARWGAGRGGHLVVYIKAATGIGAASSRTGGCFGGPPVRPGSSGT